MVQSKRRETEREMAKSTAKILSCLKQGDFAKISISKVLHFIQHAGLLNA